MEFKKNFSSNLQNLSAKQTLVLQPPPHLSPCPLLSSPQQHLCSPSRHSHTASAISLDKQNINYQEGLIKSQFSSGGGRQRSKGSQDCLMTFQKIKMNMCSQQSQKELQQFMQKQQRQDRARERLLKPSNSFGLMSRQSQENNNVRLGSMVFGSLSKKDSSSSFNSTAEHCYREKGGLTERMRGQSQTNYLQIKCMNRDGRPAKYKVASDENGSFLHCCFHCAIPLVKQGFTVEELTASDQFNDQIYHEKSQKVTGEGASGERMKLGQRIKCKIIPRVNRLKVAREEFTRTVQSNLQSIDFYYGALISYIQRQSEKDKEKLNWLSKNARKQPQKYEQKLSSALGTVDYLLRHPHGISQDVLRDIQLFIEDNEVEYPELKANMESSQSIEQKIEHFSHLFDQSFRLNLATQQPKQHSRRNTFDNQFTRNPSECQLGRLTSDSEFNRNRSVRENQPRFSFQSALEESRGENNYPRPLKSGYRIDPLEEQSEAEIEESVGGQAERKDAFRNLFPEGDQLSFDDLSKPRVSPAFKQF